MAIGSGVTIEHINYDKFAKKWKRCRDVVSGQDEVHAAGEAYLPRLLEQEDEEYKAYVKRATFYNATWRTIAGFVGMLFKKEPVVEVQDKLDEYLKDVTMNGTSIVAFAKKCVYENLIVSRFGILVDHPAQIQDKEGLRITKAQAEVLGLRPSMQLYKAEMILNWKFAYINNKNILVQVRLLEEHFVEKNEFKIELELRVKVLDFVDGNKYRIRIFKHENEEQIGEDVYPILNGKNLDFIPFYFDNEEGELDEPAIIDLVDLNLAHYRVTADYEHGCHMTGLPTPVISGYQAGFDDATGKPLAAKFYIGSTTAWVFPNPDAKASFLEFSGQGLTAIENNLKSKEAQMAAIGARMLAPEKSGVEAEGTLAMRHSGEHSVLSATSIAVSECIAKALVVFAAWCGVESEIKFEINRDFSNISPDSSLLQTLMNLVQGGQLDAESFFNFLKRADLIDPKLTFEEMQKRIDEAPPSPPIGHNGGPELEEEPKEEPKEEPEENA